MRELGMVIVGMFVFVGFFSTMIYPNLEYKNYMGKKVNSFKIKAIL